MTAFAKRLGLEVRQIRHGGKTASILPLLSNERSLNFSCGGPQDKRGLMLFLLSLLP